MPTFEYKARDKAGKVINGSADANSPDTVAQNLRKLGYTIISIEMKHTAFGGIKLFERFGRVKSSDISLFSRQLATLVDAGIPILSALDSINEQTTNPILKDALSQVAMEVRGGASLADSLVKHPRCFSQTFVSMVEAAEVSGTLAQTLTRLAQLLEYEEQTKQKIKAATRYPIAVTTAIIVAFLILTVVVLPRYAQIYSKFDIELPLPTKVLLGINYVLSNYWYILLALFLFFVLGFSYYINTKTGRFKWDTLKLKVPVFGPLLLQISISRFMRVAAIMLKTGVPILKTFDHVATVVDNANISKSILQLKEHVNIGKDMAYAMRQDVIFPPIAVQMVALGEEAGKLDELLLKTSEFFDSQTDMTIQSLTGMLEPILILFLGCGVLVMALAVFLPMWNLVTIIKR